MPFSGTFLITSHLGTRSGVHTLPGTFVTVAVPGSAGMRAPWHRPALLLVERPRTVCHSSEGLCHSDTTLQARPRFGARLLPRRGSHCADPSGQIGRALRSRCPEGEGAPGRGSCAVARCVQAHRGQAWTQRDLGLGQRPRCESTGLPELGPVDLVSRFPTRLDR